MLALVSFSVGNCEFLFFITNVDHVQIFPSFFSHDIVSSVDEAALKKRQHGSNQTTHWCVVLPIYIVHTR